MADFRGFNFAMPVGAKKLGAFGLLGGDVTVEGAWIPDPEVEAGVMLQIAGHLENTARPMLSAAAIARQDTKERFETETDPEGTEWAELDPDYKAYKVGQGGDPRILRWTQDLMRAATSPSAWLVMDDSLVFDPSVLPSYGLAHQSGSGEENVGFARDHKERIASGTIDLVPGEKRAQKRENLGIGAGNALPARPFIGLSEDAIGEIALVFDEWFGEVNEIFIHPRTGSAQYRGAGGRFGSKVGT